ncbi:hypothetical protein [Actinoplanes sp. NPDC051851]|uniref:hypothetical protein n=1 Tax=Actinoplanes sp. NPDC051851 TaxID=3154753 RepID=UPI0034337BF0
MPYTQEVRPGYMVRREREADVMHVEGAILSGTELITLTGHRPATGERIQVSQSGRRWIDDVIPAGSIVQYRGSITSHHGVYAARPCPCPDCEDALPGEKFQLANDTAELQHVNRRSITILAAHCDACAHTQPRPEPDSSQPFTQLS